MRLLGVDPGGVRTGVCLIGVEDDSLPVVKGTWLVEGGPDGFLKWWDAKPDYDVLVCEDYIVRQGVPSQHVALRTVGFLKGVEPHGVFQVPAARKVQVSNEVLKRLDVYHTQRDIVEAIRHCIIYLKHQRHKGVLEAGWPRS